MFSDTERSYSRQLFWHPIKIRKACKEGIKYKENDQQTQIVGMFKQQLEIKISPRTNIVAELMVLE